MDKRALNRLLRAIREFGAYRAQEGRSGKDASRFSWSKETLERHKKDSKSSKEAMLRIRKLLEQ
ncbi:MAG: hypothetical protein A3I39_02630 [Candidatus Yanofskybacteria bacterium RIFCSPLOWO2_02_FULL_47_9b]|uniref:Uncharacterized protein n=1 Tax=Candidatus Yanofskybacteria bacterium RIFCSPLOWO2_02_FULL_47_9b TaxID=1802708 RepID=A0A1F8H6D4_9BACT|nr:MAG: hypothetical protein A3I39_02630 [Candidatus Yanofskybacteria bacterium RIFCSPLOWO2_02_FULL_47_9b]